MMRSLFVVAAGCWLVVTGVPAASAVEWPELPEADATLYIPAQESPHAPGPRTVKVYIYYPGRSLANVNAETGLMLSLHNWGGTQSNGTADPKDLANRYNVVAISVDYLNSGKWDATGPVPYDFGYLQALDALRALYFVFNGLEQREKDFHHGRIYATGGSGGGNVTLNVNKLAPRTFACIIDLCGMAKLSDDIAFGLPGGSRLNAGYSRDPSSRRHLSKDGQELRFVGNPKHLAVMKSLGNKCKVIVVHGTTDVVCPFPDKREMVANIEAAGMDIEPHFLEKADLDGKILKSTGHSLGDRTRIVHKFADGYLLPHSPDKLVRRGKCDFQHRDEKVRYPTTNGAYVISYTMGYPVGRFEKN